MSERTLSQLRADSETDAQAQAELAQELHEWGEFAYSLGERGEQEKCETIIDGIDAILTYSPDRIEDLLAQKMEEGGYR